MYVKGDICILYNKCEVYKLWQGSYRPHALEEE